MATEMPPQTNGVHAETNGGSVDGSATSSSSPSKNEIGWYFVEQFYTTLSRTPEKLHLFYAKRSQFVSGQEAEKAPVCVGQRAIADRIKDLDIQDAKVRVTNVDSQESGRDIVAQVIGEISTKGLPHRKFVQTFVLAEQPNGYYVLNDIFRYIAEEDDEEEEEEVEEQSQEEAIEAEPEAAAEPEKTQEQEKHVEALDSKLAETLAEPEIEPSAISAVVKQTDMTHDAAEATDEANEQDAIKPEEAAQAVEEEEEKETVTEEKPKDPEPTPATISPPESVDTTTPAQPEPAAPAKPSAPKTWASMLAGNKPAVAVPQVSTSAPTQTKSAPKAAPAVSQEAISAPGAAAAVAGLTEDSQAPPSPGGWQTAGQENRKQHKSQLSTLGGQSDVTAAYIKNVTEKVDAVLLKQTLSKYGKLPYFDVSRPKNCAFVEFDSAAAFQAAVAANPHVINGVEVIVAERHRAGAGFTRPGARGGRGGGMEARTNSQSGRGGFNKDSRGNFANRGARGGGAPAQRGRGGAQAA